MLTIPAEEEPPPNRDSTIVIIEDLSICEHLWSDFVKSEQLLDTWEFRILFTQSIGAKPYFITLLKHNLFWGVIPLEYLSGKDKYYAFGGGIWNEYNALYIGNHLTHKEWKVLKNKIPKNSDIKYLKKDYLNLSIGLSTSEPSYYLDIPIDSLNLDFFFNRFSGKSRRKLQQKMRKIEGAGIEVEKVDYDANGIIEDYSCQHFGDESTFRQIKFRDFLNNLNSSSFNIINLVFTQHRKIVGAAFAIFHNNIFYAMSVGYDSQIKDIGKYINYFEIDYARRIGANRINFFADDCGWKELWGLQKDMLYKYELDDKKLVHAQKYSEFTLMNMNASNEILNN